MTERAEVRGEDRPDPRGVRADPLWASPDQHDKLMDLWAEEIRREARRCFSMGCRVPDLPLLPGGQAEEGLRLDHRSLVVELVAAM